MAIPDPTLTLTPFSESCEEEMQGHGNAKKVPDGLVVLGTLLVIVASFISCFGVNLQKWAHNLNEKFVMENPGCPPRPMYKLWRWWAGIFMMVLGSIMDMAALPFVPLSRVAALGASTIVANVIVTPIFLRERLTKHDLAGCVVTVSGTAIVCYFGAAQEVTLSSHCILELFTEGLFLVYSAALVAGLLWLYWLISGFKRKEDAAAAAGLIGGDSGVVGLETVWLHDNLERVNAVEVAPLCGVACVCCPPHPGTSIRDSPTAKRRSVRDAAPKCFPAVRTPFVTSMGPQFYPCVHAVFAGTIGAQSVMFAKAVLLFLSNAISGTDTGQSVCYVFVFLVPMLFCLWNQVNYLNVALQIYIDAIFVLPVYQAMWICTGIASGLIFYKEYRTIKGLRVVLFCIGLATALAGLAILAMRKSRSGGVQKELKDDTKDSSSPAPRPSHGLGVGPLQPIVQEMDPVPSAAGQGRSAGSRRGSGQSDRLGASGGPPPNGVTPPDVGDLMVRNTSVAPLFGDEPASEQGSSVKRRRDIDEHSDRSSNVPSRIGSIRLAPPPPPPPPSHPPALDDGTLGTTPPRHHAETATPKSATRSGREPTVRGGRSPATAHAAREDHETDTVDSRPAGTHTEMQDCGSTTAGSPAAVDGGIEHQVLNPAHVSVTTS